MAFQGHDRRVKPGVSPVDTVAFGGGAGASNPFSGMFTRQGVGNALQVVGAGLMGAAGQGPAALQAIDANQEREQEQAQEQQLAAAAQKYHARADEIGAGPAFTELFKTDPASALELQDAAKFRIEQEKAPKANIQKGVDGRLYDLSDPRNPVAIDTGTAPEEMTDDMREARDPVTMEAKMKLAQAGRAQMTSNYTHMSESERSKAQGKALGERSVANLAENDAIRKRGSSISLMKGMLQNGRVQTGAGSRLAVYAKQNFGIDMGADVDDLQAFDQLTKMLVLDAQAAQKGPQTDSDRAVIEATLPNINKSVAANQLSLDIIEALDRRTKEENAMEQRLIDNEAMSPSAIDAAIEAHFGERPVFSDEMVERAQRLGGGQAQAPVPEQAAGPKAPLSTKQLQQMSMEELESYYAD